MEPQDQASRQPRETTEHHETTDGESRPSPTRQKVAGKVQEMKGRAKQAGGALTGDTSTKVRGQVDEVSGRFKQMVADLRTKLRRNV